VGQISVTFLSLGSIQAFDPISWVAVGHPAGNKAEEQLIGLVSSNGQRSVPGITLLGSGSSAATA
jgi:hypothetical protein